MATNALEQQYILARDRIRDGELPFLKSTFEGDGWLKVFNHSETYLLMACYYRQSSVIEYLLKMAQDNMHREEVKNWLAIVSPNEYTPLHNYLCVSSMVYRTRPRHTGLPILTHILQKLIDAGFDVNQRNSYGETPLFLAVVNNDMFSVERLLRLGANPNWRCCVLQETPLHQACSLSGTGILDALLQARNIDVNVRNGHGMTALLIASQKGETHKALTLMDHGSDVMVKSEREETVLSLALRTITKTTVVPGSTEQQTCFEVILGKLKEMLSQEELKSLLLHTNRRNESLLCAAVLNRHLPGLKLLLKQYDNLFSVDCRDEEGRSLLHIAIINNPDKEIIEFLIESGVSVNCIDKHGNTPLMNFFKKRGVPRYPNNGVEIPHINV